MKGILNKLQSMPYLMLVLATFFWGTNFAFSRILVTEIPPFQLSVIRWVVASIVFFPFVYHELKSNWDIFKINWKPLLYLGLTGIAGFNTLLYIAIQYTTSINASLVNSIAPLLIVLLSVVFLKEKQFFLQYVGVIVSFFGVFIIITGGSFETLRNLTINPGDLFVVGAVLFWAAYSVLMKKYGVDLPKKPTFMITMMIGILALIPFAIWERASHPVFLTDLTQLAIVGVIYLGIFPSIVSFICWNEGVIQIGPGKASNYLYLIVFFTTILAVMFGGEKISLAQLIGGLFILSGVVVGSNPQLIRRFS